MWNKNVELNQYFPSSGDKSNPALDENGEINQYFISTFVFNARFDLSPDRISDIQSRDRSNPELI